LADENLPRQIVEQLRGLGHDVTWAAELCPGMDDADWLTIAHREQRILITDAKDFGE
jgi:predicted nuclease of predicted toxin-antitoxin system